jgi:hypothetical protein
MPKQLVDQTSYQIIKKCWQFKVPPKIVAEALDLKYSLVTLYYRSFKSTTTTGQFSSKYIVNTIQSLIK